MSRGEVRRAVLAGRFAFLSALVLASGLFRASGLRAETVRLPNGCLPLATVVGADCSVRHVARCADYGGGTSTFQTDPVGRPVERVDRALGLVAERVWRLGATRERAPRIGPVDARVGRFWVEVDLSDYFPPKEAAARLVVVQQAKPLKGAVGATAAAARSLRDLGPGLRRTLILELRRTAAGAALEGGPETQVLIQRGVRGPDAQARVLDGADPSARVTLRIYRFAVRSEPPGLALSETRFYEPRLGAVVGRRLSGQAGGEAVSRDGRPIALFRVGDPGLLDAWADQRVAACVRRRVD